MAEATTPAPASVKLEEVRGETIPLQLQVGKSMVVRLPESADRISVGNPGVADITLLRPTELYLLGKSYGTTNIILWRASGRTTVVEVQVGIDTAPLEAHLRELWPKEKGIQVSAAASSIVLSGTVSSTPVAEQVVRLAEAYAAEVSRSISAGAAGGATGETMVGTRTAAVPVIAAGATTTGTGRLTRVVNLLRVLDAQQVMLEVKVAEINRSYLEFLGVDISAAGSRGEILTRFIANPTALGGGALTINNAGNSATIRAQNTETLVKILAEPSILTLSGQEGSFLAGGRLLVPVSLQNATTGQPAIALEEKEFGVSLKFTPTVLENGRIHLKVAPEVSELLDRSLNSVSGTVLPQFSTRRSSSVVQLMDGQSLAIAGLIKSTMTEQAKRIPILGEIPILGALFRSSDFVNERTELVFIVTPRLVKPLPPGEVKLPTDYHIPPNRPEFLLKGRFEGKAPPPQDPAPAPAPAGDAAPPPQRPAPAEGSPR